MKKIKLFIFILTAVCIANIDSVSGEKNNLNTKTTKVVMTEVKNSFMILHNNKEKQNNFTADYKNSYTDSNDYSNINNKEEDIDDDTITIPGVCTMANIKEGSTQRAVDRYDICLMTEAAASFGQGQPILLGGHNTKSLKYLYKSKYGDIVSVNYKNHIYEYKVIYSNECITDNYNLFDIDTGKNVLEYRSGKEVLQIYTCYGSSNRWFVKAEKCNEMGNLNEMQGM